MTLVSLEKAIVEDLVTSKLHVLQNYVDEILHRWNEAYVKIFLEKARNGVYKNAEDDASVSIRLSEQSKLTHRK